MIKNFDDVQKLSQQNLDAGMRTITEWNKGWQTIAAEMGDYSKRSFEEGTQTIEKLTGARSIEQAMEIQADFAKRAYEDYMAQWSKIGNLYAGFAREAMKPVERAFSNGR